MVEDNLELLKMYREAFEHEGFEFATAQNGIDGVKLSFEKRPNLILLDLLLPGMDGISVMKILRENNWGKTVPIIIFSNMDTGDEIMNAVTENEPTYYLVKANNDPSSVIEKVKDILKEKPLN